MQHVFVIISFFLNWRLTRFANKLFIYFTFYKINSIGHVVVNSISFYSKGSFSQYECKTEIFVPPDVLRSNVVAYRLYRRWFELRVTQWQDINFLLRPICSSTITVSCTVQTIINLLRNLNSQKFSFSVNFGCSVYDYLLQ